MAAKVGKSLTFRKIAKNVYKNSQPKSVTEYWTIFTIGIITSDRTFLKLKPLKNFNHKVNLYTGL